MVTVRSTSLRILSPRHERTLQFHHILEHAAALGRHGPRAQLLAYASGKRNTIRSRRAGRLLQRSNRQDILGWCRGSSGPAPAKVQSALLEAMQERQVTLGGETMKLPSPFLVLATENPIDQEGTYPLPEAQVDRFMFKVLIDYPSFAE